MWLRIAGSMAALGLAVQACEVQDCNNAGCISGLVITASSAGPLPEGEYRVDLLLDGVAHSCSGPVPSLSALTIQCEPDAPGVTLYLSEQGPVAVPPGTMPSGLYIEVTDSTPRRIEMEISRDGNVVAAETFTPEYATNRPNGDDCPPVCQFANIEAAPLVFD